MLFVVATHIYCSVCSDSSRTQFTIWERKLDYTIVEVKLAVLQKHLKDDVPKPLVLSKCAEMMEMEGMQVDGLLHIGLYRREPIPYAKFWRLEGMN